ncbi:protein-lysine N-methyltransferase EEF2KMT [Megalops cyprinoides]|uniref:protein-lysine N-methyltransferase EEF2KMT n=1 Tax=Megalops cyprinoides TaxID=118141 RepID=UPI00186481A6|nr:protein-lysine N-methyltransferase EEF2KMT [Megalops cyprinoides]
MNYILNNQNEKSKCTGVRDKKDMIFAFQTSFFAMCRLSSFPWSALEIELRNDESPEILLEILQQTCRHSLCRKTPPSVKYRRLFLSELIKRHEATTSEPLDELYEAFGEILGVEEEPTCYKSYLLPSGDAVSLSESTALISEGTTGLVTWEAALCLAEWALDNLQVFSGRTVLELGSGVGLTGVAICRSCSPRRYVFSDCHPSVLQRLHSNMQLNGLVVADDPNVTVTVRELDWETVTEDRLRELGADTVIAADVVYDPAIISCLVGLLSKLLRCAVQGTHPDIYISSTIRNPETYSCFKSELKNAGIRYQILKGPITPVFPYNRSTSIELIKLFL